MPRTTTRKENQSKEPTKAQEATRGKNKHSTDDKENEPNGSSVAVATQSDSGSRVNEKGSRTSNKRKRQAQASGDDDEAEAAKGTKKQSPRSKKAKKDEKGIDIASVHLPGEENGSVPIYDTCNEIRRKINQHLRSSKQTKAAFVRTIGEAGYNDKDKATTRQLNAFLDKKGPTHGADSPIFYGAYVYFEKLRIAEGKNKSKLRTEMEREWGESGMDRIDSNKTGGVILHASERAREDKYGKLRIQKR